MKNYLIPAAIVFGITLLSTFAFYFFVPESLKYPSKPLTTDEDINKDIPYPDGAKELSKVKTENGVQVTFETNKTSEDLQSYYKNVYAVKGWSLVDSGKKDGFLYARFQKGSLVVTVSSSASQTSGGNLDSTIVIIEEIVV